MRICLLGPVEVVAAAGPVPLGGVKSRLAFTVLALSSNREVADWVLIDALWGDDVPPSGAKALHHHLHRLRRQLSQADDTSIRIETGSSGYLLRVDEDDLDVMLAERLLADGRVAIESADMETAARHLTDAERLWRGRPLGDLAGFPAVAADAQRLEELRLSVVEARADADLALGRHAALIPRLETAIADAPLRERLWAQLMVALFRADRQADALAAYQRCRRLLRDELGIEPNRQLVALDEAILRQDTELGRPPSLGGADGFAPPGAVADGADAAGLSSDHSVRQAPLRLPLGTVTSATLPTGTVTFLFTDIVGSTPLWDSFPDAMGIALARHDEIVRGAIDRYGGHVISTGGDGFVAVFARARLAVEAALCAQRALEGEVWLGGPMLRVRMGVHTGEAEERGGDYFGPPLNRAARIMAAANGGQIVLSALTAGLVSGVPEFEFHDLGLVHLKGVVEPVHVVGVAGDGHAWTDTPLVTPQVSRGNLPCLPDEMVGDLADLQRRVANLGRARVVTLTGSGGVGKTRAAIEVGWLVVEEFVDGVWLVELGPIGDADLVLTGIAAVLGVHPQPAMTVVDSIVDWCYGRRMMLVLDNCEHVLDPVAELTAAIAAACPTVTIVATSREPLGVDGEIVVRIPSLDETYGVELFVMRATAADTSFEPTAADREVIAVICRRLDGIPLAIELAAARIRSLNPTELLERLDDRLRLLGGRGRLERHRTLRATVAWSYQLLASDEQLLFDRLSVFAGSFDHAAAAAIAAGDGLDGADIVDLVGGLVDKSMVIAVRSERGTRYRLLETLRQYGEESLDERGATARFRDAHLVYFSALVEHLDRQWNSPDQANAGIRFDDDWDNLGAAHTWSISAGAIDAATAIVSSTGQFAIRRVRRDHQEWCARTRGMAESAGVAPMRIAAWEAGWAVFDGDLDTALAYAKTGLDDDDDRCRALCHNLVTEVLLALGRTSEANEWVTVLRSLLDMTSDPYARNVLANGIAQINVGRPDAEPDIRVLLESAVAMGPDQLSQAIRVRGLQRLFVDNEVDAALADMREAIRLNKSVGTSAIVLEQGLAIALIAGGRPEARSELRRIIAAAYDERYWIALNLLYELPPFVLNASDPESAAIVFGYCEQHVPPWGDLARQWRERTARRVAKTPSMETLKARGAAMDRHEIVAFMLAALAEP